MRLSLSLLASEDDDVGLSDRVQCDQCRGCHVRSGAEVEQLTTQRVDGEGVEDGQRGVATTNGGGEKDDKMKATYETW
jgi:hypothetical protein